MAGQFSMSQSAPPNIIEHVAVVVAAYVSTNSLPAGDLPAFITSVHGAIASLQNGAETPVTAPAQEPAVPVKRSVQHDFLICLEDGRKLRSMRRYLARAFNMTPDQYREKWGLPADYPMVAPAYSATRSALAKAFGLGQPRAAANDSRAEPKPRGRPRKAA